MVAVVRLLVVLLLVGVGIYLLRHRLGIATNRPRLPSTPRPMPYCRKCESNRQVVERPDDGFRWYCQRCREAF